MDTLIHVAVRVIIGWLFIEKLPAWLKLTGTIAAIIKIVGVLIIISALLEWL